MREEKFRGKLITVVVQDDHWEIVEHPDAVAILVARGRELLGVRQPRPAVGMPTWEIPAGLIDPGESPEEAAHRELAEEVQMDGELSLITHLFASPGFTDETCYLFELTSPRHRSLPADPGEHVVPEWRDALDVWNAVAAGEESTSGVTLLAVRHLLAQHGTLV